MAALEMHAQIVHRLLRGILHGCPLAFWFDRRDGTTVAGAHTKGDAAATTYEVARRSYAAAASNALALARRLISFGPPHLGFGLPHLDNAT